MNLEQNQTGPDPGERSNRRGVVVSAAVGLVAGVALVALLGWMLMPGMMITVHESKYGDVTRTCDELKQSIEAAGWSCPAIRNMNNSMAKHGVDFPRQVRLVELCKAGYANRVLETNSEVSTLMPCAFGVYEGADGKVYISGMNMGLMGKMFGGRIAEVMGGDVARDEHAILSPVVAN
mgnify:CR=1 FL=1